MPGYSRKPYYFGGLDFNRACVALHLTYDFSFTDRDAVATARNYTDKEAAEVVEDLREKHNQLLRKINRPNMR